MFRDCFGIPKWQAGPFGLSLLTGVLSQRIPLKVFCWVCMNHKQKLKVLNSFKLSWFQATCFRPGCITSMASLIFLVYSRLQLYDCFSKQLSSHNIHVVKSKTASSSTTLLVHHSCTQAKFNSVFYKGGAPLQQSIVSILVILIFALIPPKEKGSYMLCSTISKTQTCWKC